MFEQELQRYEALRQEHKRVVGDTMNADDYKEYNEILFSTHSCGIEGNSFSVDDSRELKQLGLGMVVPQGKKLYECFEIADHFNAYNFIIDNLQTPLTEALVKETNRKVVEHTIAYHAPGAVAGVYTDTDMAAGDTMFGAHETLLAQMPKLLQTTEQAIVEASAHPMIIASRFHGYFEYLHPFRDGNGRTGRLLSNYILMRMGHPLLIIRKEERQEYINALRMIRQEGTDEHLTSFFINAAIRHFSEDITQKKHNSRPVSFMF